MPNKKAKARKHDKVKRTAENKARKKAKRQMIANLKKENAELKEQLNTCQTELKEATK